MGGKQAHRAIDALAPCPWSCGLKNRTLAQEGLWLIVLSYCVLLWQINFCLSLPLAYKILYVGLYSFFSAHQYTSRQSHYVNASASRWTGVHLTWIGSWEYSDAQRWRLIDSTWSSARLIRRAATPMTTDCLDRVRSSRCWWSQLPFAGSVALTPMTLPSRHCSVHTSDSFYGQWMPFLRRRHIPLSARRENVFFCFFTV